MHGLKLLENRSSEAYDLMNRAKDKQDKKTFDFGSYRNGEVIAYLDASRIMEAELRRLCNKFQNGYLTIDDFGVVL